MHRNFFYSDSFCLFYDATTRSVKVLMCRCRRCVGRHRGGFWKREAKRGGSLGASDPSRRRRVLTSVLSSSKKGRQADPALKIASPCRRFTVIRFEFHTRPHTDATESRTQWQRSEDLIKNASPNGHEMLLDGKAPLPGQI